MIAAATVRRVLAPLVLAGALVALPVGAPRSSLGAVTGHTNSCTTTTVLDTWPLPDVLRQLVTVPVEGTAIAGARPAVVAGFGGLIIFGDTGPTDFATVVSQLRAAAPRHGGLLVMSDEEGGGVWRLANLLTPLPWARSLSALSPAQITAKVATAARAMAALGINMDLAPVLDIDGKDVVPGDQDADGLRAFSGNAATVAKDGVAYLKGLTEGHVVGVIKHFPGLGGVSPNTDVGPAKTKPWATVQADSLPPFVAAIKAGATAMMISNATIPGLTTGPATVARPVYSYVRQTLHFTGLLMTDSLSAGAVSGAHLSVVAAAVQAVEAGADDVLYGIPATGSALALGNQIVQALFDAVADHALARTTAVAAAAKVLAAKGVNLCRS